MPLRLPRPAWRAAAGLRRAAAAPRPGNGARRLAWLLATATLAGCTTVEVTRPLPPLLPAASGPVVPERYLAAGPAGIRFNALATWPTESGGAWLIAGSAAGHALTVFDADSGAQVREIDGRTATPGPMLEPTALAVFGDRLFVAEAGANRVEVLSLPDFARLGAFGAGELRAPGGLWIRERGPEELAVYVADASRGKAGGYRYRVEFDEEGRLRAQAETPFEHLGEPDTGDGLPPDSYHDTATGIAWWSCGTDAGYWVAIDSGTAPTRFQVFDRALAPRGAFRGATVDGSRAIAVYAPGTAQFPFGALFALHGDGSVAAFDLGDVVRALQLDPACTQ
ncbi:hypothetical protein [Luteimonas aquatica]|uniref:hypothetical protein n=1 Tax=Luteimonas aquatica TaxID=450364 RepID=UPI001F57A426|nr:hypothetical protein [Luteimonas aquatica]